MSGTETHSADAYATMDRLAREQTGDNLPDEVRALSVEIAGDIVTMDEREAMVAAMELDAAAETDERVTREIVNSGKLAEIYSEHVQRPSVRFQGDPEQAEEYALNCLRTSLAFKRFRIEYPDKFDSVGDTYYSGDAFNRGSILARNLVAGYLSEGSRA